MRKLCIHCRKFYGSYLRCTALSHGECDCPRCQGFCQCAYIHPPKPIDQEDVVAAGAANRNSSPRAYRPGEKLTHGAMGTPRWVVVAHGAVVGFLTKQAAQDVADLLRGQPGPSQPPKPTGRESKREMAAHWRKAARYRRAHRVKREVEGANG